MRDIRMFSLLAIVTIIVFLCYKGLLVLASKCLNKLFNVKDRKRKFDFGLSIAMQMLFVFIWIVCIDLLCEKYGLSNLVFYVSFCLIGVFCVIWCYFSWDVEHIFVKPRKAEKEEKRIKKIVIYSLILVFVLFQGYFQTLHLMDSSEEIDILFSVTNYSVVVATIAFDRVMNQICN